MADGKIQVDAEVIRKVREELEQALAAVKALEGDAEARGIPLRASGANARYRIYETTRPLSAS